ncbi:MAG: superinfection immunity protein [Alphaproteobacteria bacterium]|nr:superinfection immunity protein [Alphaproteobacteria bacterium]
MAPTYLAIVNDSSKYNRMRVRVGSWMFGWTFIGWLFALFVSTKK